MSDAQVVVSEPHAAAVESQVDGALWAQHDRDLVGVCVKMRGTGRFAMLSP